MKLRRMTFFVLLLTIPFILSISAFAARTKQCENCKAYASVSYADPIVEYYEVSACSSCNRTHTHKQITTPGPYTCQKCGTVSYATCVDIICLG